jgi:hypothetical protein
LVVLVAQAGLAAQRDQLVLVVLAVQEDLVAAAVQEDLVAAADRVVLVVPVAQEDLVAPADLEAAEAAAEVAAPERHLFMEILTVQICMAAEAAEVAAVHQEVQAVLVEKDNM